MSQRTGVLAALTATALSLLGGIGTAEAAPGSDGRGCARPGVLFCENFEQLPLGGASSMNWGIDTRNGTLTVERRAGRGGQVLHVRTADNGRAFLRADDLVVPATGIYGRMRLRVDAFPTAPDWANFTLVEGAGSGSTEIVRPVGGQYAPTVPGTFWGIGADGGPTGDWTAWTESAPVTEDTWQCVEWRLDPTTDTVTTWFDRDDTVLSASQRDHGGNDVPFELPSVDTVKIGLQLFQAETTSSWF